MTTGKAVERSHLALVLVGGAGLLWLALVELPAPSGAGVTAPQAGRLFFFHVPIAFTAFAALAVAFYHSLVHLVRAHPERDRAAQSAVEAGVLFSGLTLATGMIWGDAEWGVAWRWSDPKLVLVLVMFVLYLGSLLLRREIPDPERRGRVLAVYTVAAFPTIPLTWFAHRIWLSQHPVVFAPDRPDSGLVTPGYLPVFLLGLVVFLAAFSYLYRWRLRILGLRQRLVDARAWGEVLA